MGTRVILLLFCDVSEYLTFVRDCSTVRSWTSAHGSELQIVVFYGLCGRSEFDRGVFNTHAHLHFFSAESYGCSCCATLQTHCKNRGGGHTSHDCATFRPGQNLQRRFLRGPSA